VVELKHIHSFNSCALWILNCCREKVWKRENCAFQDSAGGFQEFLLFANQLECSNLEINGDM
jgi:hypothetical protein